MSAGRKKPDWRESVTFTIQNDMRVTGRCGFTLYPISKDGSTRESSLFTSDLAYTSRADAEQAANDAAHAAWLFRHWDAP